jgi:N-acetylmuramoyl-L-alanine amidase
MAKKVFIGVGHGGKDPGAVGINGIKEKDVNLVIALACRQELVRHGVEVGISRTKDEDDKTAVAECNAFNPDYALDIHNNAGGGDGVEVYHHYKGGASKSLAQNVLNEIVALGQNSRGLKTKRNSFGKDYYEFIRCTKSPAIIVECCFLDNAKDVQFINTDMKQKDVGKAIAKGVLKTLGIAYKEPVPEKLYRVQVFAGSKAGAEATQKRLKAAGFDAIIV